jgi:uncharacterized protein
MNKKKVVLIHGLGGSPNGGWRPWLMRKLADADIYAYSLAMPDPDTPSPVAWEREISTVVESDKESDFYLVGHSLGVPAILRYLERSKSDNVLGAILVSGPLSKTNNEWVDNFLLSGFDFRKINSDCRQFVVIHGDDDPLVPVEDAKSLSLKLDAKLIIIKGGGHLNGDSGWYELPDCLRGLQEMWEI